MTGNHNVYTRKYLDVSVYYVVVMPKGHRNNDVLIFYILCVYMCVLYINIIFFFKCISFHSPLVVTEQAMIDLLSFQSVSDGKRAQSFDNNSHNNNDRRSRIIDSHSQILYGP